MKTSFFGVLATGLVAGVFSPSNAFAQWPGYKSLNQLNGNATPIQFACPPCPVPNIWPNPSPLQPGIGGDEVPWLRRNGRRPGYYDSPALPGGSQPQVPMGQPAKEGTRSAEDASTNAQPGFENLPADNLTQDAAFSGRSGDDFGSSISSNKVSRQNFDPGTLGDFFGGGGTSVRIVDTRRFNAVVRGFNVGGGPNGAPTAQFAFGIPGAPTIPDDAFSVGPGRDLSGNDQVADQYDIAEPLFPTDIPTSPGPGFTYDGGTATLAGPVTNGTFADGDFWFLDYSYSNNITGNNQRALIASPGAASRRVRIAEGMSPEIRDRVFVNYSYFDNAQGRLGDVNRWVVGSEVSLFDKNFSLETRLPLAATLGSTQSVNEAEARNFEVGNVALVAKFLFLKNDLLTWSGGTGLTLPLADDSILRAYPETDVC